MYHTKYLIGCKTNIFLQKNIYQASYDFVLSTVRYTIFIITNILGSDQFSACDG